MGPNFGSFVALPPSSHKDDVVWPWDAVSPQMPCARFSVGEESVCACAQHALAMWRSPLYHSNEARFLNLPGLDVCGSFELQGALAKAAWSPTACTAAITVMWSRRGNGQPLGLFLVACSGELLQSTHFPVKLAGLPPHSGFIWSPDGTRLAGLVTTEQSRLLRVIDTHDCTEVARVEVDPSFAVLRCPDSTQWADGGAGRQQTPRCQWLPCSSRLVVWLMMEWTWYPDDEPDSDDPAQQLYCAAFLAICGLAEVQLLDMSYTSHFQHVQQPEWGLGGSAARESGTLGMLLVPAARA